MDVDGVGKLAAVGMMLRNSVENGISGQVINDETLASNIRMTAMADDNEMSTSIDDGGPNGKGNSHDRLANNIYPRFDTEHVRVVQGDFECVGMDKRR